MVLLSIIPIALYAFFGKLVGLLQLVGAIEAVHIPIIVGLTLYMNYTTLPHPVKAFFAQSADGVVVFYIVFVLCRIVCVSAHHRAGRLMG